MATTVKAVPASERPIYLLNANGDCFERLTLEEARKRRGTAFLNAMKYIVRAREGGKIRGSKQYKLKENA